MARRTTISTGIVEMYLGSVEYTCNIFDTTLLYSNVFIYNKILPGRLAQLGTCLATDASLIADPWVVSSIPVRSHTFVEIMK